MSELKNTIGCEVCDHLITIDAKSVDSYGHYHINCPNCQVKLSLSRNKYGILEIFMVVYVFNCTICQRNDEINVHRRDMCPYEEPISWSCFGCETMFIMTPTEEGKFWFNQIYIDVKCSHCDKHTNWALIDSNDEICKGPTQIKCKQCKEKLVVSVSEEGDILIEKAN